VAKKLGHGTNYYGTPRTMAKHAHAPVPLIENFQHAYFSAFPCIKAWHSHVIHQIETTGVLYNLFGRRRHFFGRGNDASTHRKAIAFNPQSSTGEEIDRGIMNLWKDTDSRTVQLLLQVHDSILFQIPFSEHADLIPYCLDKLKIEIELAGGRKFHVPLEAKVGWNWGDYDKEENPFGLKKWKGEECRSKPSPMNRLKDYL
jgi:DNA polymerase I-like protein with 3'-5' exonuclease and polymerase domains